jgi:hypothetical protein
VSHRIDYYRNAFALASNSETVEHATILLPDSGRKGPRVFCSCCKGNYAQCGHADALRDHFQALLAASKGRIDHWEQFLCSRYAKLLLPCNRRAPLSTETAAVTSTGRHAFEVSDARGGWWVRFRSDTEGGSRLLSRLRRGSDGALSRSDLLRRLEGFMLSDIERQMLDAGTVTARLGEERSVWCRLAYHCFREAEQKALTPNMRIDSKEKLPVLDWQTTDGETAMTHRLPQDIVWETAQRLQRWEGASLDCSVYPEPVEIMFRFSEPEGKSGPVHIEPVVRCEKDKQSCQWHPLVADYMFGTAAFLPSARMLVSLSFSSAGIVARHWSGPRTVDRNEFSALLEQEADLFSLSDQTDLFDRYAQRS